MSTSRAILLTLVVVTLIQCVVYYPRLPAMVASHFDGTGHPNGWMSREAFLLVHLGMMGLFVLVFFAVPKSTGRIPASAISLPNRDYWLTPERRDQAMVMLKERMLWYGNATLLFMLCVFQMAIEANLDPSGHLSSAIKGVLVVYFAFTFVWLIELVWAFRRPRLARDSSTP